MSSSSEHELVENQECKIESSLVKAGSQEQYQQSPQVEKSRGGNRETFNPPQNAQNNHQSQKKNPYFRTYQLPIPFYQMPAELYKPSQYHGNRNSRTPPLATIGMANGARIMPPPPNENPKILRIYSSNKAFHLVRKELDRWVQAFYQQPSSAVVKERKALTNTPTPPQKNKSSAWSRIQAFSETKELAIRQREKQDAVMQTLKLEPNPLVELPSTGYFLWPSNEYPISILGNNMKYLDALREKYQCFLTYEDGSIKVSTDHNTTTHSVLIGIRHILLEISANFMQPIRSILLNPPTVLTEMVKMVRQEYEYDCQTKTFRNISESMRLHGTPVNCDEWVAKREERLSKNAQDMEKRITFILQRAASFHGQLKMSIQFGTFAFTSYKRPKDDGQFLRLQEVWDWISSTQVKGHLIPLNYSTNQDLLRRCCEATNVFAPMNISETSLHSVQPNYSATLEFKHSNGCTYVLRIEYNISVADVGIVESSRKWSRAIEGRDSVILDISVADLEKPSWGIKLVADKVLGNTHLPRDLQEAQYKVISMNRQHATQTCHRFVSVNGGPPVSIVKQYTSWKFRLAHTSSVIFELSRIEHYPSNDPNCPNVVRFKKRPSKVEWEGNIYDQKWALLFAQNERLQSGDGPAAYKASIETFFDKSPDLPKDAPWFQGFYEGMSRVAEVLGMPRKGDAS